jgi:hypothetical protein
LLQAGRQCGDREGFRLVELELPSQVLELEDVQGC